MKQGQKYYNTHTNVYKSHSDQQECVIYNSVHDKSPELVEAYAKTDLFSHRYLAYRDIPLFLKKYVNGFRALDYGTGTGISAAFLHQLNFKVIGIDINFLMLEKAREDFPLIQFLELPRLNSAARFDLIFSSFVLFDMKSKAEIIKYLSEASSFLDEDGIFIVITGSEELYCRSKKWVSYDSNFEENKNLKSGDVTKLRLLDPNIEFKDYYWTQEDYMDCFRDSNLEILEIHKPLGLKNDLFEWKDELFYSPFITFIARKFR